MANILNESFSYTYNGTLLKEIFYKPTVGTLSLSDFARIIPGSQFKIQMHLANPMSKLIKAGKGCGRTETADGFNLTSKAIELNPMKMFVTECAEDFEGSVGNWIAEDALKSGNERNDIGGTQLETIINTLIEDSLRRDVFRIFSFGDLAAPSTDYNQMDGMWPTLISQAGPVGAKGYCVQRSADIGTADLTDGQALSILKATYEQAPSILDQMMENEKDFKVTRSIFDNLVSSYESVSTGSDLQVTYLTDGIPQVRYRGVPVVKNSAWDDWLMDADNPLNPDVRHLVLYTTKENHGIAVGNEGDLNAVDGWYSKDDDIYKFSSKMRMGYNYVHCDLQVIAF